MITVRIINFKSEVNIHIDQIKMDNRPWIERQINKNSDGYFEFRKL